MLSKVKRMLEHFLSIDRAKQIDVMQQEVIVCEREIERRLSGQGREVEALARKMLKEVTDAD